MIAQMHELGRWYHEWEMTASAGETINIYKHFVALSPESLFSSASLFCPALRFTFCRCHIFPPNTWRPSTRRWKLQKSTLWVNNFVNFNFFTCGFSFPLCHTGQSTMLEPKNQFECVKLASCPRFLLPPVTKRAPWYHLVSIQGGAEVTWQFSLCIFSLDSRGFCTTLYNEHELTTAQIFPPDFWYNFYRKSWCEV